ncbi:hypothetical protein M472_04310 [Sphingobacterium paucimobilis HER1398]|uniref:PAS domain-containing protein n=1 Tax=Sphingobacterium paucimobilis HER1398 TaxID=1346330 RepID=U2IZ60_9SPHI|nr:hypothetical protein M472_04310 [Sphingobacterium paucimobilis HER1398]
MTEENFHIVDANDAYLKLCALDLKDMKGKGFFSLFPLNPYISDNIWLNSFHSVLAQKTEVNTGIRKLVYPLNAETTFLDVRYYEIHHTPILTAEGNIEYIIRTLVNVTQQVIQEELYDESQKSVQYGNWWINTQQQTMELSSGFKDILEVPPYFKPSLQSTKQFYSSPDEETSLYRSVNKAMAEKKMFKKLLRIVTAKGNKRWLLLTGRPDIVENICIGVRGVAKDVSEKLAYMDKIENQHNNLKYIAFAQSHLVRAPLARILALVHHLKERFNDGNIEPQLFDALSHSAHELDAIIHNITNRTIGEKQLIVDDKE